MTLRITFLLLLAGIVGVCIGDHLLGVMPDQSRPSMTEQCIESGGRVERVPDGQNILYCWRGNR